MNQAWQQFLVADGASVDPQGVMRFAEGRQLTSCALFDLSHLRLIEVTGEDAEVFLQGQFTNDVHEVTPTHWQMDAYCTPKGRMLASFRLIRHAEGYLIQLPTDTVASVLKRLPMFVLRSRVRIRDASDDWVRIGIAGDCAPQRLEGIFSELPAEAGGALQQQGVTLLRLPGITPRFELIGGFDEISAIWKQLRSHARPTDAESWSLLEIRAGIPQVYAATVEAFVPQMANLQLIDGISFTKGCYTGQEVVARMKYLGKLKRRMYLARVQGTQLPKAGDELYAASGEQSAQGAGKVVDAQPSPSGGYELLAVTEIALHDGGDLRIGSSDGVALEFLELPYLFEADG